MFVQKILCIFLLVTIAAKPALAGGSESGMYIRAGGGLNVNAYTASVSTVNGNVTTTNNPLSPQNLLQGFADINIGFASINAGFYSATEFGAGVILGDIASVSNYLSGVSYGSNLQAIASPMLSIFVSARTKFGFSVYDNGAFRVIPYGLLGYNAQITAMKDSTQMGIANGIEAGAGLLIKLNSFVGIYAEVSTVLYIKIPDVATFNMHVLPKASVGVHLGF
jgi:hypothetical protein